MFNKNGKKKGFTLIEMLAVIAIVAILISIIVPIVGNSVDKAAAATNAANLRSIEGEVAALYANDPSAFNTMAGELEQVLGSELSGAIGGLLDSLLGTGASDAMNETFSKVTAENGVLTLPFAPDVEIETPGAKELKLVGDNKEMYLAEGTQMTILIGDDGKCIAMYGDYTIEDFVDIAEDGSYDATEESKSEGEDMWDKIQCAIVHDFGDDAGRATCSRCGEPNPAYCECCQTTSGSFDGECDGECNTCTHGSDDHKG